MGEKGAGWGMIYTKEIYQAQLEIIQGYYNRIMFKFPTPQIETCEILDWLEDDMEFLQKEHALLLAKELLESQTNKTKPK